MTKRPRSTANPNEQLQRAHRGVRDPIDRLAKWARRFIGIVSGSILLLFAWIQIKEVPVADAIQKISPELLIKTSLIIYFAGWVGGANFDTRYQQKAYSVDPKLGAVTTEAFVLVAIFLAAALALLWARSNERLFAALLGVFTISNIMGWRHIVKRVRPIINASRSEFTGARDYFSLEKLNVIDTYMTGRWQRHRFTAMLIMVALICVVTFSQDIRHSLGELVNASVQDISPKTIDSLLPGICLLLFVMIAEGWIWAHRVGVWSACMVIDELAEKYELKRL